MCDLCEGLKNGWVIFSVTTSLRPVPNESSTLRPVVLVAFRSNKNKKQRRCKNNKNIAFTSSLYITRPPARDIYARDRGTNAIAKRLLKGPDGPWGGGIITDVMTGITDVMREDHH